MVKCGVRDGTQVLGLTDGCIVILFTERRKLIHREDNRFRFGHTDLEGPHPSGAYLSNLKCKSTICKSLLG